MPRIIQNQVTSQVDEKPSHDESNNSDPEIQVEEIDDDQIKNQGSSFDSKDSVDSSFSERTEKDNQRLLKQFNQDKIFPKKKNISSSLIIPQIGSNDSLLHEENSFNSKQNDQRLNNMGSMLITRDQQSRFSDCNEHQNIQQVYTGVENHKISTVNWGALKKPAVQTKDLNPERDLAKQVGQQVKKISGQNSGTSKLSILLKSGNSYAGAETHKYSGSFKIPANLRPNPTSIISSPVIELRDKIKNQPNKRKIEAPIMQKQFNKGLELTDISFKPLNIPIGFADFSLAVEIKHLKIKKRASGSLTSSVGQSKNNSFINQAQEGGSTVRTIVNYGPRKLGPSFKINQPMQIPEVSSKDRI